MTARPTWIEQAIDVEECFALTAHLVSFRSYPGEEGPVQQAVAQWFRDQGMAPELRDVAPNRPNVIVTIANGDGPSMLLNGHTDTVLAAEGWECDPWQGRRDGDRFYGLGACDMKSGVAAAMIATRELDRNLDKWRGTVTFTSVVDEEAYSIGAHGIIDDGIRTDYCIVTEASWEWPCLGSIGKMLVRIDAIGKAAHATWPSRGINAAEELAKLIARIHEVQPDTHPRMTATQTTLSFHSGSEIYVITVPERATATINRHTVPGETREVVLSRLQALADSLGSPARFEFSIDAPFYPPWEIEQGHPLVQAFAGAYQVEVGKAPQYAYTGYGDPNLFSTEAGIPTVMFGPKGGAYHERNEWIEIPSIAGTARVLLQVVTEMLPA